MNMNIKYDYKVLHMFISFFSFYFLLGKIWYCF